MTGISFDEWIGVDQHGARQLARDPEVGPVYLRVMFAAIGWSNLIGHAEFAPGGLAMVLQTSDPKTGELHIPSTRQVNKAIERARENKLVGDDSSRHCLLAPTWWEKAGGTGGKTCSHHHVYAPRRQRNRDLGSPGQPANRDLRSPGPGLEKSRGDALTCGDANPSMTLISTRTDDRPPADRKAS
ncbi:hypothetical protein FXB39_00655 [Nocardioides sp. BGMRC 2183]|nr:hypothetical protein FXB39_00655 [Nocardioides sp. BGMRC 2183]